MNSVHRPFALAPLLAAVASALLVCAGGAQASEMSLGVNVVIQKQAKLHVLSQPGAVRVTPADISRGWVEVPVPLQLAVQSNSPRGYLLMFDGDAGFARQARVQGLDHEVQIDAQGGVVPQPGAGHGVLRRTLELKFRFFLAQDTTPGDHAWPLRVSVAPL